MESKEISAVRRFVAAINQGSARLVRDLMTDDHTFVDSCGTVDRDLERMEKGWGEFFRAFPDYRVELQDLLQDGKLVAAFGSASGTYNGRRGLVPENRIAMPAAWKAIVEDEKIKLWQVYADWTAGYKIIEADRRQG